MADIRDAPQDFYPDRVRGTQHWPQPWSPASAWEVSWGWA
jgi:hypothetical protein